MYWVCYKLLVLVGVKGVFSIVGLNYTRQGGVQSYYM